jgi:hypothetical protein
MKKFYLFIAPTFLLLLIASIGEAQFLGGTYSTVPAGGDLSVASTWVGGAPGAPPAVCNNCEILIFGNSLIANTGIVLDHHSLIIIEAGAVLTIGAYVQIKDTTEVLIGSNPVNQASLVVSNSEGDLFTQSFVRLANDSTFIDATSGGTSPGDSLDGVYGGGLYYVTQTSYNVLISANGYGNPVTNPPLNPTYMLNCNNGMPPFNTCFQGVVYGPAISDSVITDNSWEFEVTAILPVQLLKFAAVLNSNQTVGLSWATAQEVNSDYFSVQRSTDGVNFVEMGKVKAKGFSSIVTNYAFTDQSILNGKAYYRLQIFDLDGKFTYSKVLTVSSEFTGNSLLVFSNPFLDQIRLQINLGSADQMVFSLTDVLGRSILKQEFRAQEGSNFVNLQPGNGALPGVYFLNIKSNTINQTIKLIKE